MRLSFPYFLGSSVWTWLHAVGERAAELQAAGSSSTIKAVTHLRKSEAIKRATANAENSVALVDNFIDFMRLFTALYPCPYCRHHLNEQVMRNGERHL